MVYRKLTIVFLVFNMLVGQLWAQPTEDHQFLAFGGIRAWTGLVSDWNKKEPKVHIFSSAQYPGHADFASVGLKTGVDFKTFKSQVQNAQTRLYFPFFIYDVRSKPITKNGETYHWVLHVEDYSYTDEKQVLGNEIARLVNVLKNELKEPLGNGLLLLEHKKAIKPNAEHTNHMPAEHSAFITRKELLKHCDVKSSLVLNAGRTYGYVKFVPKGEEDGYFGSFNEILVFEKLPKRIYPVAGIISLEPQHELSHINLLAKNRGTVNVYIQDKQILPNLESLENELAELVCERGKIILKKGDLAKAKKHWAKRQNRKTNIPLVDGSLHRIVTLGQDKRIAINNVGSKAYNYHLMLSDHSGPIVSKGLIKPALAVPFSFYSYYVQQNGIQPLIDELTSHYKSKDEEWRRVKLHEIQKAFNNGEINKSFVLDLASQCVDLDADRIRIRSSTNCEDLPDFNGAGLYLSKGFDLNDPITKLRKKIKQVYASLWTIEAFEERSYFGIDHKEVAMALLISPAFEHEYANGVLMSIPQKTDFSFLINTQFGDESISNPTRFIASERLVFNSNFALTETQSQSEIHPIFLDSRLADAKQDLLVAATHLHEKFARETPGYGIDLEFKVMYEKENYKLYIKQVRLIGNVLPE